MADNLEPDGRAPASPRSLESFLRSPKYYRGYLAGSHLGKNLTGATAVHEAWMPALLSVLGHPEALSASLLNAQAGETVLISSSGVRAIPEVSGPTRDNLSVIRDALDRGSVVLRAEPSFDGVDWAVFSPRPLAKGVCEALTTSCGSGVAAFVIPQARARGEHKFYFERYDLSLFEEFRCV